MLRPSNRADLEEVHELRFKPLGTELNPRQGDGQGEPPGSGAARVQIEALGASIDLYRLEVGSFPPDLQALVEKPPGVAKWDGPYLKKRVIPKDPWGNDYVYRYPGKYGDYDLMSLGADNSEGGEGEQKDIVSWE